MQFQKLLFVLVALTPLATCATPSDTQSALSEEEIRQKAQANLEELAALSLSATVEPHAKSDTYELEWPVHSIHSSKPHVVFGDPVYANHDDDVNMKREYGAFTIYYDEKALAPLWTAIKLSRAMADKNGDIDRSSRFKPDNFIRDEGYAVTKHTDYNNIQGQGIKWHRGHMVQFDDARGYGKQAAKDSFFTSNVTPQLASFNPAGWLTLEQLVTEFARDYGVLWVFTGPIYDGPLVPFESGRIVPKPDAFYKIVVAPGYGGSVDVLAFIMEHKAIARKVKIDDYLVSIDDIEQRTGLDFLTELPDGLEDFLEGATWEIWPDQPGGKGHQNIVKCGDE